MRRAALLAIAVLLAGCGSHAARPAISLSTKTALVDAPPRIVVRGSTAHARIVVRAVSQDLSGQAYRARIVVRADGKGVVRVPTPTLLASMHPPGGAISYRDTVLWAALSRIPLDYFGRALRWLARQHGVDANRVVVDRYSRGSEAALLAGAYFPQLVHSVVAVVPGIVVLCAYPAAAVPPGRCTVGCCRTRTPSDRPAAADPGRERIRGRVMLVCGGGDLVWPSCPMAEAIVKRRHGRATQLLEYPDAGHGIASLMPNVPQRDPRLEDFAPLDNARARAAAWPRLLRFLTG